MPEPRVQLAQRDARAPLVLEREARFQWDQSLTLEPEPVEAEKIKKKLVEGLPPSVQPRTAREAMRNVRLKKRKETKLTPPRVE